MKMKCSCGFEKELEIKKNITMKEAIMATGLVKDGTATCPTCGKNLKGSL